MIKFLVINRRTPVSSESIYIYTNVKCSIKMFQHRHLTMRIECSSYNNCGQRDNIPHCIIHF